MDEAQDAIGEAEAQLAAYLKRASKELGGQLTYVSLHKETHVLEVPQASPCLSVRVRWSLRPQAAERPIIHAQHGSKELRAS